MPVDHRSWGQEAREERWQDWAPLRDPSWLQSPARGGYPWGDLALAHGQYPSSLEDATVGAALSQPENFLRATKLARPPPQKINLARTCASLSTPQKGYQGQRQHRCQMNRLRLGMGLAMPRRLPAASFRRLDLEPARQVHRWSPCPRFRATPAGSPTNCLDGLPSTRAPCHTQQVAASKPCARLGSKA